MHDGGSLLVDFLVIMMLVLINGVFSMSEIAVVTARRARMLQLQAEGDSRATMVLDLASNPNRFLSTIQIGISLIAVVSGAYGGAAIAPSIVRYLAPIPFIGNYAYGIALVLAVVITTYLSLVIGELVPKRMALQYADRIALIVVHPMVALSRLVNPIVRVLGGSTELVTRALGMEVYTEIPVTEEEIRVMVEQGASAGVIDDVERELVDRAFRMGDQEVEAIMTPRTEVIWLDVAAPVETQCATIQGSSYSRFPVARESLDQIIGVVHGKDLLHQCLDGRPLDLEASLSEPLYVPENMRVFHVLELFKREGVPIAFAVDEYGVFQGLITLDDILEGLVGDIQELDEIEDPSAVQRDDGSWLLDGLMSIDDFKALFDLGSLPDEGDYQTVGGFTMSYLGFIPSVADEFTWCNLKVEVVDMDGTRVDKVLVTPMPPEEPESE